MSVSVTDIQLVVLDANGINQHLARWSRRFTEPWRSRGAETPKGIPAARNRIFRAFRDKSDLTWLLMCDDDVVPVEGTEPLLESEADVAGARIIAKTGREAHAKHLSVACIKVSRKAVQQMRAPWFGWPRGGCECQWFGNRMAEVGLRPVHAGVVGHRIPITVLPGPEFKFDVEIRGENNGRGSAIPR